MNSTFYFNTNHVTMQNVVEHESRRQPDLSRGLENKFSRVYRSGGRSQSASNGGVSTTLY